jgi:hypothetical protein
MTVVLWVIVGVLILKTLFQWTGKLGFVEAIIRIIAIVFMAIGLLKLGTVTTEALKLVVQDNFFLLAGSILFALLTIKWIFASSKKTAIQTVSQPKGPKEIQDLCLKVLQEEGYKGSVNDKGHIDFKHEGALAKIIIQDDYVLIVYFCAYEINNEAHRAKALEVMNAINVRDDIAHLDVYDESDNCFILSSSPIYLPNLSNLRLFFSDYFVLMRTLIDEFSKGMAE